MNESETSVTVRPESIPAALDRARAALAEASTNFERLQIRDQAKALQAAAAVVERKDVQTLCSTLVWDAERAIAKANPPRPPAERSPGRGGNTVISDNGILGPETMRQIRSVHAKYTDEQSEALKAEAIAKSEPITRRAAVQKAPGRARAGTNDFHNDNEWYTPPNILSAAEDALGGVIDIDPASNRTAQKYVKARTFYTVETDGLAHPWEGTVFLNPPYDAAIKRQFIQKLADEYEAKRTTAAVVVVSYDFSPAWFAPLRPLVAAACLTFDRVTFWKTAPEDGLRPGLGTAIIYVGGVRERFKEAFEGLGMIWGPF